MTVHHLSGETNSLLRNKQMIRQETDFSLPRISFIHIFMALVLFFVIAAVTKDTMAQMQPIPEDEGSNGFGLALRKLPKVGSFMYICAHPDDENNALYAKLGRGEGLRTGLLTLTRGDGGQNELGPELFQALGVLRTEELASMHRYDLAQQFYSRAFEFGYSFSVEETFQKWGREEIVKDIVRVLRTFRPTVVLTMNPSGTGGGQHHQASAQLTAEAFRLAGDPEQFPDQISEGLRPWRPLRLFQSKNPGIGGTITGDVVVDLSGYDPLLGESYVEFGTKARSLHRCQGMGSLARPRDVKVGYFLTSSTIDSSRMSTSFYDQIDTSLQVISTLDPSLESSVSLLGGYIDWAVEAHQRANYSSAVKAVMTGLDLVRTMKFQTVNAEAKFLLEQKEKDFLDAARKGNFIYLDALLMETTDSLVTPGETFKVSVQFQSRGENSEVEAVAASLITPPGWSATLIQERGDLYIFQVKTPEDAAPTKPYWYRKDLNVDRYATENDYTGIEPYVPAPVIAKVTYLSNGISASVVKPVHYRRFDLDTGGERRSEIAVAPKVSISFNTPRCLVTLGNQKPCKMKVRLTSFSKEEFEAVLNLSVPAGWKLNSYTKAVKLTGENDTRTINVILTPPSGLKQGKFYLKAKATVGTEVFNQEIQKIDYHHIRSRQFFKPAEVTVSVIDVKMPRGLKVGYIMGVGDQVGMATEQMGAVVTYLDEDDLESGNLSQFDVIITGVRAYLKRGDLIQNNSRLLEYVKNGGHMVVQYNKYEFMRDQFTPYPARINRPHDRITVEEAPVKVLLPRHQVFRTPNRLNAGDWNNWVQERGLYFFGEWDSHFTPLLEIQDPWPYNNEPKNGSLMITDYGRGSYIYTGLAFFRQLPAGTEGAFRLWSNLISFGKQKKLLSN
jgi:LmbE family N-acetylglucosaminyl deacetylase